MGGKAERHYRKRSKERRRLKKAYKSFVMSGTLKADISGYLD